MQIFSFSPFGYEGSLVTVEVDLRRGIPAVDMVGLADGAVKESRERMKTAIINSGFEFPAERILISLSPADVRKEGAGFDLAIALAVLAAANKEQKLPVGTCLVMGELELSGRIRPVRGVHAAAATAISQGINMCIVPAGNGAEAIAVQGMKTYAASDIKSAFQALFHPEFFSESHEPMNKMDSVVFAPENSDMEFSTICGQSILVRGLQIAAAGGHNLLAYGPPGCGKTMALQRFKALLPLLTKEESQPVTRIYSLAGFLPKNQSSIQEAPFRIPHQSASLEGIVGGGINCRPGEISLAHNGVLFLDEAGEFKTSVLQALRVPIETGKVTLSRAGRTTTYPAKFQLLVATNPCPCGNFGVPEKICLCSARSVEQYWKKFSAPLLDRIDIRVPVFQSEQAAQKKSQTTFELRKEIAVATEIQRKRQSKKNSQLLPEEIFSICKLEPEAEKQFAIAIKEQNFSPRAVSSCMKLARTIADMSGNKEITAAAIQEAVFYRKNEGGLSFCF
ncbi:MAG: YifB family Mg chelatase-like AAA ATPase [Spirochaetaceae bacterium]|nr:YifB family Mg chelatase-like AAA ATPase [Spirochaetaceae bacterium]